MRPSLPIILLSSLGDEYSNANPGLFNAELSKPVKQATLRKHILLALQKNVQNKFEEKTPQSTLSEEFAIKHPFEILVAEDNVINQQLIMHVLNRLGYKPNLVEDGALAVEAVKTKSYDVIFMDMQMPEMDGLTATRSIRKLDLNRRPTIIALTANAMQGDREECLRAGMDDYLSKPIKLEDLTRKLERWARINTKV